MYFYTHLYIAKELYKQLSKNILLDFDSFSYGNIKPDIPSKNRKHHTQENYLEKVSDQISILKKEEITVQEFSIQLGEICHYISDFFCYYHLNEHLHKKNLHHFFYEISMHISLITYRFEKINCIVDPNLLSSSFENPIISSFHTMFELYSTKPNSKKKDMDFALSTSLVICEKILEGIHFPLSLPFDFELNGHSTNMQGEQLL